jgi:hypothetical protein
MEIALALIYILLQIMPADTQTFTLNVTPDKAFYGTKQEGNVWRIESGRADTKSLFGDVHIDRRQLIIKTKEKEIPFEAADKLALPENTDWKTLKTFGRDPVTYEVIRAAGKINFAFTIQGAEQAQAVTASFKP